jgi:nitroimidazol reductase NimA-like FMN-containing flavoprotein (pyridoxamine 5'-phosphate oxidase superfamily)
VEEAELSEDPAAVLEEIPEGECLQLLSRAAVGRLGVVDGRQPVVVPVNFASTPDGIVVSTDIGTKLEAGSRHLVALEIDEIDPATHLGWSVLVKGHAFDITDALDDRSERLQAAVVESWAPGPKARRLLVEPTIVTGRRLRRVSEAGP